MKTMPALTALMLAVAIAAPALASDIDLHAMDYSKLESRDPVKTSYVPNVGYPDHARADIMDIHAQDYSAAATDEPVKTSYQVGKGYI